MVWLNLTTSSLFGDKKDTIYFFQFDAKITLENCLCLSFRIVLAQFLKSNLTNISDDLRKCDCVWVCARASMCVGEREIEQKCVCKRERERENKSVCVCV